LAKVKRVAIVGLGPFGKEAEKLLRGDVGELLIVAKDNSYLDQFKKDGSTNPNVWALKDIDEESIIEGLVRLQVLPAGKEIQEDDGGNSSIIEKTLDVAIVDLAEIISDGEIILSVIKRIAPYAAVTIVPTRNPDHVGLFKGLVPDKESVLSFCPEKDAAGRIIPRVLHGLEVRDMVRILPNLYEATLDVPESLTGFSIKQIASQFDVDVLFFIQSVEVRKGRNKKVVGYTEQKFNPKDDEYCIRKEDTAMRVTGKLARISKLGSKI